MDSDDENNVDYVSYGTPLDPIEEDDIPRKKPISLEEQVVLDKQGRRRFHGAFTGGFSAGFFNSVGSLEGWKPSTFKSSRTERIEKPSQKPEDFMDEEDMDEFGIAPKIIRATSDFREQQTKKRKHDIPRDGPIPGEPVLHSFLHPVRDTVGVRLLKKMGWKPGQGVGPRLTRKDKKQSAKENERRTRKVYGCSLPEEFGSSSAAYEPSESSDEDEKENNEVLYAPDDIKPFKCEPKDNFFGIGYSGLDRRPILFAEKPGFQKKSLLNMTENRKKVSISGQAFGVGAFEVEDEDIYSTEDMSHYDFSLEDHEEKRNEVKKGSRWDHPNTSERANYAGDPLEGFVLSERKPMLKFYPPPVLPSGFQSVHQVRQTRFEVVEIQDDSVKGDGRKKGLGRHDLTAADREIILSGHQRKPETVSNKPPTIAVSQIKVEPVESEGLSMRILEKNSGTISSKPVVDAMLNKGKSPFRPFVADPDKQNRYEQYLGLLKSNQKHRLSEFQPLSMTEWERDREKMEFEQASKLYQPLSGVMSDRFVTAIHPDVGDEGSSLIIKFAKEEVSERQSAAKMKMFGRLTRDRIPWTPCSLLYKRFNVPDPGGSNEPVIKKRNTAKFSVFDFLAVQAQNSLTPVVEEIPSEVIENQVETEDRVTTPVIKAQVQNITSLTKHPINATETEKEDQFPDPPNKIDLFKAIFLSSSESESEDETSPGDDKKNEVPKQRDELKASDATNKPADISSAVCPSELNVKRNTSPSRGVFANLDLDAINSRTKCHEDPTSENNAPEVEMHQTSKVIDVDIDSGAYGPRLPANVKLGIGGEKSNRDYKPYERILSDSSSSSEEEWVEKSSRKHKKSKHHKSQHKKSKKHKSKHKHKRK